MQSNPKYKNSIQKICLNMQQSNIKEYNQKELQFINQMLKDIFERTLEQKMNLYLLMYHYVDCIDLVLKVSSFFKNESKIKLLNANLAHLIRSFQSLYNEILDNFIQENTNFDFININYNNIEDRSVAVFFQNIEQVDDMMNIINRLKSSIRFLNCLDEVIELNEGEEVKDGEYSEHYNNNFSEFDFIVNLQNITYQIILQSLINRVNEIKINECQQNNLEENNSELESLENDVLKSIYTESMDTLEYLSLIQELSRNDNIDTFNMEEESINKAEMFDIINLGDQFSDHDTFVENEVISQPNRILLSQDYVLNRRLSSVFVTENEALIPDDFKKNTEVTIENLNESYCCFNCKIF